MDNKTQTKYEFYGVPQSLTIGRKYSYKINTKDENSFIYEPETGNQRYNDNYYYKAYKEKFDNTNNKNESSSDNDYSTSNRNMIFLNNKSTIYNNGKNYNCL